MEAGRSEKGIRSRHRIAAQQESVLSTALEKAMQKKAVFAEGQNDFARVDVFERAAGDFDRVARPHRRQHALTAHLQAQAAAAPQRLCR
jgi:hypothetical protein